MLKIIDKIVKKMVILLKKGQVEAKIDYMIHENKFMLIINHLFRFLIVTFFFN